jgi:hypothetical protein
LARKNPTLKLNGNSKSKSSIIFLLMVDKEHTGRKKKTTLMQTLFFKGTPLKKVKKTTKRTLFFSGII